jgi:hypothetical protein
MEAVMSQSKFVYFGRVPTNVCFNGTSFPVAPGDVIKCHPQFIADFIPAKFYKQIPDSDPRKPRHTFGRTPFFMKPDPTGGLPVRSDPNAGPRLANKSLPPVPFSPAIVDDQFVENPYDLGMGNEEEVVLENTTALKDGPKFVPPEDEMAADEDSLDDDDVANLQLPDPEPEKVAPNRSVLRKGLREDLINIALEIKAGEIADAGFRAEFDEIDTNSLRGVVFDLLWRYYGYDQTDDAE